MSNYVNNLNELINTKKELKDIIIESTGENPSEVFSYYPSYIRSAIAAVGGGASEEAVNSYISAYLSTYNYIDQDTLSSNSYITESDVAQMGYITMGDVSACGYITQHQDLSSYATKSYVVDYVATYAPTPDLSSYVTKTELSSCSYITMDDVSACGYITINDVPSTDLSGYVSKTELSAQSYLTSHQDLSGYVSKTELSSCGYITINDVPSTDLSGYVSKTELSAQSYLTSIPSEYITQTELSSCGYITANDVDLSDYVSYDYADENYVSYSYLGDIEEITEYILGSGSSSAPENIYATKAELNSYVSKTSLQSMAYITMDDIDACGYITNSVTELEGPLFISRPDAGNGTYGFCSYTHIVAGTQDKTTVSFLASKRKCGGVEGNAYMSAFFVNSDGRSKFTHKSYTNKADIGLETDDAFLCFNAYGFKLSYSGIPGTAASTEYDLIHSGNINNYIPSGVVIDENIIPKETNTYTLGDFNHFYHSAYIARLRGDNSGIWLDTNANHRYYAGSTEFRPYANNQYKLGSNQYGWASTYSYNYYLGYNVSFNSASDYNLNISLNGSRRFYYDTQTFTGTGTNKNLGTTNTPFAYTYTSYLILNGTDIMDIIGDVETLLANI